MGDLGVLVSFKITRGIKLVVGRVTEGVKGGLREFWGGPGGSKGVCLTPIGHFLPLWKSRRALDLVPNTKKWSIQFYPYRTHFSPLEVLYSTRFGSKHYIMVQLANVY